MSRIEYNPSLNDKVTGQLGDLNVGIQIPLSSIKTLFDETPPASYKVYTALLNQNGEDGLVVLYEGELTIGVTYLIADDGASGWDFTNVGAPNNDPGTYFVATGTTPNSWGINTDEFTVLSYYEGAPVVTVLENTIGNIWFEYGSVGQYNVKSSGLFINGKTTQMIGAGAEGVNNGVFCDIVPNNTNQMYINSVAYASSVFAGTNGQLFNTPIEIRVYN